MKFEGTSRIVLCPLIPPTGVRWHLQSGLLWSTPRNPRSSKGFRSLLSNTIYSWQDQSAPLPSQSTMIRFVNSPEKNNHFFPIII